jgi:Ni2+-binding GTPase involved in maturation of urease and hydrogenase
MPPRIVEVGRNVPKKNDIAAAGLRDRFQSASTFDRAALVRNVERARAGIPILEVSSRTGRGLDAWLRILEERAAAARAATIAVLPTDASNASV